MTEKEAVMLNALKIISAFAEARYPPDSKHKYEGTVKAIKAVAGVTLDFCESRKKGGGDE